MRLRSKWFESFLVCACLIFLSSISPFASVAVGRPFEGEAYAPSSDGAGTAAERSRLGEREVRALEINANGRMVLALSDSSASSGRKAESVATSKKAQKSAHAKKPAKVRKKVAKHKRSAPPKRIGEKKVRGRHAPKPSFPQGPAAPDDVRYSVLVVGDSLAVGVGMTLGNAFDGREKVFVRKMGITSTGLDSPAFFDWKEALRDALAREKFDLVVVVLGANDANNGPGTPAWERSYEYSFSELLKITAEKRIRTLVVGLPPMRKPDFSKRAQVTNEAMRNAASRYPGACVYIDAFKRFSDEAGNFTDSIKIKGEWKKVRAGDGVHFTGTGYLLLSKIVADEALKTLQ